MATTQEPTSSPLADLFPGWETRDIATPNNGSIHARIGGGGPPLVLVHGFPQTHAQWHKIAPFLAKTHTVVALDLRGYGHSHAPKGDGGKHTYTKREMAREVVHVMQELGYDQFTYVGHDRGARVGYRLALDHPSRLNRLVLIDIIPTVSMWDGINANRSIQVYHWTFLAQPSPMPETLLQGNPIYWLEHTLASWTKAKTTESFDPRAMEHYRDSFTQPERIHALCEDYRAGAFTDVEYDRLDIAAGNKISCPTFVIWGAAGIPAAGASPLDIWRSTFAPNAEGEAVDAGHFVPEENPEATVEALRRFLV
eukprot:comp65474_c0_seq1/m.47996 comp65474_c0_seq1/g.47996  ORF comp65474_c0_seq1/g.47996 comp65474_c0_seq1/m.47996 type:complete len:310 (-) comp65474_c0_seq1:68-997(-)